MKSAGSEAAKPLRVLVVDDTALYRRTVADSLASMVGVEVLGTASNGKLALERVAQWRPDLVTLDIEMPELNGIEVLERMASWPERPGVIVLSSLTRQGSAMTVRALELGAFDFVTKPEGASLEESLAALHGKLWPAVQEFQQKRAARGKAAVPVAPAPAPVLSAAAGFRSIERAKKMIVVGVSTGGPQALGVMLAAIPKTIAVPILIVQHMPPLFTHALAESLSRKCAIAVKEAEAGEIAQPGTAYLAPGGTQMKVKAGAKGEIEVVITNDGAENHCRPSVDYLFRSVALQFPGAAIGVVLTGMGNDGAQGIQLLKKSGAHTIAQDEATSVVYGMPREAAATGAVDEILPLPRVAERLSQLLAAGKRA